MNTSFEVGAVFRIVNEASPALRTILRAVVKLNEAVSATEKSLTSLGQSPALAALAKQFQGITTETAALAKELSGVNRRLTATGPKLNTLAAEWDRVAISATNAGAAMGAAGVAGASAASGPWGPRAGRAGAAASGAAAASGGRRTTPGHRAGQTGFHMEGLSVPLPGAGRAYIRPSMLGGGMKGNAALVAAGALAWGVVEEGEIQDIIARALITGQVKLDKNTPMMQETAAKTMREIVTRNAVKGGFQPKAVGEALLLSERQFGGLDFDKRMRILDILLPKAITEAKLKEATLPQAMEALIGMAHQTGVYDEAGLIKMVNAFTYASTITPVPIDQFRRALSYSLPILHAGLGMAPESVMFMTAMTQTAGITNSKSGTWIRTFFERLMPVRENPTKVQEARNAGLQEFGLADENLMPTWQVKDATGAVDWTNSILKLTTMFQTAMAKIPDNDRLNKLTGIFGERGGGFGALLNLPQFVAQFPLISAKMKSFQAGDDLNKELLRLSPMQAAKVAIAEATVTAMNVGTLVIPQGVSELNTIAKTLDYLQPKPGPWGDFTTSVGRGMAKGWPLGVLLGGVAGAAGGIGMGAIPGAALGGAIGAVGMGAYEGAKHLLGLDGPANITAPSVNVTSPSALGITVPSAAVNATSVNVSGASVNVNGAVPPSSVPATVVPGKQGYNAVPPPSGANDPEKHGSIYMDGRKVGEVVSKHQSKSANGPLQGSAYYDGGATWMPADYSYARG